MKTRIFFGLIFMFFGLCLWSNTIASSTMIYEGPLTYDSNTGSYSGVLPMVQNEGTDGDGTAGYDLFGKNGVNAYFGSAGPTWTPVAISNHDAWSTWTPDTPDWYQYSLNLYVDGSDNKWAVRNHAGATETNPWDDTTYWGGEGKPPCGVPMSGAMEWFSNGTGGYAEETDVGAYLPGTGTPLISGGAASHGGGAGCWDMDWSWGSEVVPLEWPTFWVSVEDLGSGNYRVIFQPDVDGTIAEQDWYVASSQLKLGAYTDSHPNALADGHVIADPFQINMLYQEGILNKDITNINTYLFPADDSYPPDHTDGTWTMNYSDNDEYVFDFDIDGGLPVYTWPNTTPVYTPGVQWTLTSWGQTILAGDIIEQSGNTYFRVYPEATYRPWVDDPPVNNVEVFSGNLKTEVEGYTFSGTLANIGENSILTCGIPSGLPDFAVYNATQDKYYLSIQAAIDDADAGDVIEVAAGTYVEDVTIDKSLTLQGEDSATTEIQPTVSANPAITVEADNVTVTDFAITHPTILTYGIKITSPAATGLTLQDLEITNIGAATAPDNGHGLYIDNSFSSLDIIDCNFSSGYQSEYSRGIGVFAPNNLTLADFDVSGSTFEYFFVGIYLRSAIDGLDITTSTFGPTEIEDCTACVAGIYIGDGTDNNFDIENIAITDNTFTSYGRGVYVWNYAEDCTISSFNITNNTFTNSIWSSAVRFIAGLGEDEGVSFNGITVSDNTLTQNSDVGGSVGLIDFRTYCALDACDINVANNDITLSGGTYTDAIYGIMFFPYEGPFTNTLVDNNTLDGGSTSGAGTPPSSGIAVLHKASTYWPAGTLEIDVTNNTVTAFDNGISVYDLVNTQYGNLPTGSTVDINYNSISGNSVYGVRNDNGEEVDATSNWWGDASGPTHTANPDGTGDAVTDHVDYNPWWGDAAGTYSVWYATDDAELAAALAAAEDGDVIYLVGGTYGPITITKGLTISGETGSRDATVFDGGGSGTVVLITDDDVVFENCTVQHSGTQPADAGIKIIDTGDWAIQNVTVQNNIVTSNANGIACILASGTNIFNNSISNNSLYGVVMIAGSNNTIESNTMSSNILDAIALDNLNAMTGDPDDLNTGSTGNFIKTNTISDIGRDGVFIGFNCDNNSITNSNIINTVGSIGIHVWRNGSQTITGNTISNADGPGIKLRGLTNGTVTGNTITNNGIGLEIEAYYYGGSWYPCTNNDISDNKIYGNTLGVKGDETHQTEVNIEENWWGDPAGPTPPGGRYGNGVTTNVDYDPWWIDEGMTVLSEDVDLYVDAPDELIQDDETQTYSVKVAAIAGLRGFEVQFQYPKAYFAAASNFVIGAEFSNGTNYPDGYMLYPELITDTEYWKYKVTGSYLGGADGIDGTHVVLFTFDMASLADVENVPTGSVVDLTAAILKDDQNPYNQIPWDELTDFTVYIDSSEPTMTHDNDGDYTSPYTLQTGVLPELDFTFTDNYNLDDVQYLVQAEGAAAPTLPGDFSGNYIVENFAGASTSVTDWFFSQGELDPLADGTWTIYYLVLDDAGNYNIYDWDFIKDTSAPAAVTWVSCLTTPDANNSIDLAWTNPTDAVKNHIWYLDYDALTDANGYPEYNPASFVIPAIPAAPDPYGTSPNTDGWTFIEEITAATTYQWTGMARGYYYLVVFAEDASGNIGPAPAAPFYRESISYWPGDVEATDGDVDASDIAALSAVWGTDGSGNPACDAGPTVDNGRRSLPTPDDVINIEDLMIFAMNYANTNYTYYPREGEIQDVNPITIELICYHLGDVLSVDLVLSGNNEFLRGLNIPLQYAGSLQLLSVESGEIWPESSLLLHTDRNNIVEISGSTLGSETIIAETGIIATINFQVTGYPVDPEFRHMTARDIENQEVEIIGNPEYTEGGQQEIIPVTDVLLSNYPNPFNPATTIAFGLKQEAQVSVVIYNTRGQKIRTLVHAVLPAGYHQVTWQGVDDSNRPVSSGVYFYEMQTDDFHQIRKAILLK